MLVIPQAAEAADNSEFHVEKHYFSIEPSRKADDDRMMAKTSTVDFETGRVTTKLEPIEELSKWVKPERYYKVDLEVKKTPGSYLTYGVMYDAHEEKPDKLLFSYHFQTKKFRVIKELPFKEGKHISLYVDQGLYSIIHADDSASFYSLETGKFVVKTPESYVFEFKSNFLFSPILQYGDLIFFSDYPNKYKLNPNGKLTKLQKMEHTDPNFQYSKKVGKSTYRRYKTGSEVKKELIAPNGKVTLINKVNLNVRDNWQWTYDMFSPKGKYVVAYKILGLQSSQIEVFDTDTGKKIMSQKFSSQARFSDGFMYWKSGFDHVVQTSMSSDYYFNLKNGIYVRPSQFEWNSIWTFSSFPDSLMVAEDPIAVKYKDRFVQYSGQGTFVTKDSKEQVPVRALMNTLSGSVTVNNGETTLLFNNKKITLDKKKVITWNGQLYYPLRDIAKAFDLKVKVRNSRADFVTYGYPEIELY